MNLYISCPRPFVLNYFSSFNFTADESAMSEECPLYGFAELFRDSWSRVDKPVFSYFKQDRQFKSNVLGSFANRHDLNTSQTSNHAVLHSIKLHSGVIAVTAAQNCSLVVLKENLDGDSRVDRSNIIPPTRHAFSCATLLQLEHKVFVACGDADGQITVFEVDLTSKNSHKVVANFAVNKPVKFIAHQSISILHRGNQNILYLWVMFDDALRFLGCKLPNEVGASSAPSVKKLQQYFQFECPATHSSYGTFHKLEVFHLLCVLIALSIYIVLCVILECDVAVWCWFVSGMPLCEENVDRKHFCSDYY